MECGVTSSMANRAMTHDRGSEPDSARWHGDGGLEIAPGKKALTDGLRAPDDAARRRTALALARAAIARARDGLAPRGGAEAPPDLELSLETAEHELGEAERLGADVAALRRELDRVRDEAAPHLALAPSPAPPLPESPWSLAYATAEHVDECKREGTPPGSRTLVGRDRDVSMTRQRRSKPGGTSRVESVQRREPAVGKRARTDGLVARRSVHEVAAAGVDGAGTTLPHLDRIQDSFGRHDVTQVRAHVGGDAAAAAEAIGAEAYATGDRVAFASAPTLHTAAHEAAHTVQQRGGVQLLGGVGVAGDAYEQHADAVADAVVRGESAEALLDEHAGAGPTQASTVQRRDRENGSSAQPPSNESTIVIDLASGDTWSLSFKFTFSSGPGAARGETDGPVDHDARMDYALLKPKLVMKANDLSASLQTTLAEASYDVQLWEGLRIDVKVAGPEASVGSSTDISLAKVEVSAEGIASHWIELPDGVTAKVKLSGTFTIGGKLLAKLAELAEIDDRIKEHTAKLEKAANDLEDAQKKHADLDAKRKALVAERDTLAPGAHDRPRWDDPNAPDNWRGQMPDADGPGRGIHGATRAGFDDQIAAIDRQMAAERERLGEALKRAGTQRAHIAEALQQMDKVESTLDGKIARKLGRRITTAARQRIARVVSRLVPLLNLVGLVMDVASAIDLFQSWRDSGYGDPTFFDGGPDPFGDSSEPMGDGRGGGGTRDDAAVGATGQGSGEVSGRADEPAGGATDGSDVKDRPPRESTEHPAADKPAADHRKMHRAAKRVLRAMERRGFQLNSDQIAALGRVIPPDLDDDALEQLIARVMARGIKPDDVHEMIGFVADAVANLTQGKAVVTVDGEAWQEDRPAGGREPTEKRAKKTSGESAKPGKSGKSGKKAKQDRHVALEASDVSGWFRAEGDALATTHEYELWRIDALTEMEETIGGKVYLLVEAEARGTITPDGLWDVEVALQFVESGGTAEHVERFRWMISPGTGSASAVVADSIEPIAKLVRPSRQPGGQPEIDLGGVAQFDGYSLRVEGGQTLGRASEAGAWTIEFVLAVVNVAPDTRGALIADDGSSVAIAEDVRFRKTIDVVPLGRAR
jgi:hypothetical protein